MSRARKNRRTKKNRRGRKTAPPFSRRNEMLEESKEDVWPGRYFVSITVKEYRGYKNVRFHLFHPEMDRREIARLLEPFGPSEDNRETQYVGSYVMDTFHGGEVIDLENYFKHWDDITFEASAAKKPKGTYIGFDAMPVGGGTDFYMFSDNDNYPLNFKVWGYFDIRDCESTSKQRVEWIGQKIQELLIKDPSSTRLLFDELKRLDIPGIDLHIVDRPIPY
jgi:hypothetical protein